MTEVLLEELLDSDIDWIVQRGRKRHLSGDQCLIQQGQLIDACYILLSGSLVAELANSLVTNSEIGQGLLSFFPGEVVGEKSFLQLPSSTITIRASENSDLLELPSQSMQARLSQDPAFACRFYRAIAILLFKRFQLLLSKFARRRGLQVALMQDVSVFLGELHDSDVDWMVEYGKLEEAHADQVLIHAGRAVENLYVVLEGELTVTMAEQKRGNLNRIFDTLRETEEAMGRQIARMKRGEIVGETALLDTRLSDFIVKAKEPSVLLALPRQQLALKLQQDPAMGARFYRVLAILLTHRLEGLIDRLNYSPAVHRTPLSSAPDANELDLDTMDALDLGSARFDWMLKRLRVRGG